MDDQIIITSKLLIICNWNQNGIESKFEIFFMIKSISMLSIIYKDFKISIITVLENVHQSSCHFLHLQFIYVLRTQNSYTLLLVKS